MYMYTDDSIKAYIHSTSETLMMMMMMMYMRLDNK